MVGDRMLEDVGGAQEAGLAALLYDPRGLAPGPGAVRALRQIPARVVGK
jgi:FMN phosphatase YigB (HAD superfamily)